MTSYFNLLKYAATGIASPDMMYFDRMRASTLMGGGTVQTLTGIPPLSFKSDGSALTAWVVLGASGGVGDKTANLMDLESYLKRESVTYTKNGDTFTVDMKIALVQHPWYFSEEDMYVSITGIMTIPTGSNIRIYIVKRDGTISGSIALGGNGDIQKTVNVLGAGIKFDYSASGTFTITNLMLNAGRLAAEYEPYGYALPISCGGVTQTVYLQEPLGAGESVSMEDTGITITPIEGENTLTVGTTLPPSEVSITGRIKRA